YPPLAEQTLPHPRNIYLQLRLTRFQRAFNDQLCFFLAVATAQSLGPQLDANWNAQTQTIHLHLHGQHVGLIRDINLHAQRFVCEACPQILLARRQLHRRQQYHCSVAQEMRFSHAAFTNPLISSQAYEELFNVRLPAPLKLQSSFVVFDFESVYPCLYSLATTKKYCHHHLPSKACSRLLCPGP
ncbi:hypothetical protein RvY_19203, partial [Ramazzottius varieornatus]